MAGLRYTLFGGRRSGYRRAVDGQAGYVDRYDPSVYLVALGVLVLSCLDALMTLKLISHGAVEANPIMNYFLNQDVQLFIEVKILSTAFCLVLLVVHAQFHIFRTVKVTRILHGFFMMYLSLFIYEIFLLDGIS